jgi:hypothetical protein
METVFPQEPGYAGAFFVGFRKRPHGGGPTERVGTVVVKRTYDIDPAGRRVTPAAEAEDVLTADETVGDVVRRESDVVPFKPESDVVVLGFAGRAGQHSLRVDGQDRLSRVVGPPAPPAPDLFGWEPRTDSPREEESGTFSDRAEDYPPEWPLEDPASPRNPLPADFSNRFFNGYLRSAAVGAARPFPHLPAAAQIHIVRPAPPGEDHDYRFGLAGDAPQGTLHHHEGPGPDDERGWTRRPVPLLADTLVIDPERNRCVLVWRGLWDADAIPEDRYRRLVVTGDPP